MGATAAQNQFGSAGRTTQVMGVINGNILLLPLYEVHQIGRAAAGEPTLME